MVSSSLQDSLMEGRVTKHKDTAWVKAADVAAAAGDVLRVRC